ncbi:MAG: serine/threonine-protein kinase [Actinomycetota bacterium]
MTSPAPTPHIDGIEILDVIARGGQSTVYRGRQPEHDREVAVKVHDGLPAADARRRAERERRALARVSDHPAVISLLGAGTTAEGARYLVLELATQGSLEDRLAAGPLGVDEATELVICLAAALEHAHRAGVVHCDVKPANVVRTASGEWKLADFGVAAIEDGDATSTLQVSFGHAAPEVFEGAPASPHGDVYSLGSTLLTLLTGEVPFGRREGEAMAATVHRLATHAPPDPREAGVADPLARLIEVAMHKHPEERPPSAWFLATALDAVRSELGLAPVRATFAPPTPAPASSGDETVVVRWAGEEDEEATPTERPTRRRRRRPVLVAAAVVALAAAGAGSWARSSSDPAETADAPLTATTVAAAADDPVVVTTTAAPAPAPEPAADPAIPEPEPAPEAELDAAEASVAEAEPRSEVDAAEAPEPEPTPDPGDPDPADPDPAGAAEPAVEVGTPPPGDGQPGGDGRGDGGDGPRPGRDGGPRGRGGPGGRP